MRVIERLAARMGYLRNFTKQIITGGDLNLTQADWKGVVEGQSETQAFINKLVWDNEHTKVVGKPTRGCSLLGVYLVYILWHCTGISDH